MTVKRRSKRTMIADDLGLSLLVSPYDPILLAVGIMAPKLTKTQKNQNMLRACAAVHRPWTEERRERVRGTYRFTRTAAGKNAAREVSAILQRLRFMGEVRNK